MTTAEASSPFDESEIDPIESEIEDTQASLSNYEIITYPTDYSLEGLVLKWEKEQVEIPGFQRKYVWTLPQASKLVESFLLGLPVPALFLYVDPDTGVQQVIDGQQRLLSIVQFFKGRFKNAASAAERVFKLTGLSEDSPYAGMTYDQIRDESPTAFARLNDSVMRAFIVKQLDPSDSTSIYHIFERLNTGGATLLGQEIRNCVYHGTFNDLICELNEYPAWRLIYGKDEVDSRMRDVELVLRCLSLAKRSDEYQKPMKDFLSIAMREMRSPSPRVLGEMAENFAEFCETIVSKIGPKAFHAPERLSAAKLDAVFVAMYGRSNFGDDFKDKFDALMNDQAFHGKSSLRTTDKDAVQDRIRMAREALA